MSELISSFDIAASGMAAQRIQMDVIAQNLANANVSRSDGQVFRPQTAVFAPSNSFADEPDASAFDDFAVTVDDSSDAAPTGVQFAGLVDAANDPQYHYDPGNPLATASGPLKGFVETSDVDPISQMVGLVGASRAYDADVSALQAAKQMDVESIDIGQL